MWRRSVVFWAMALAGGLGWAGAAAAQQLSQVLEVALRVESTLFDAELARYSEARREERRAFQRWDQLVRRLDDALQNREVSIEELRRLESESTLARETAFARSRQVTDLRQRLFDRMERMAELEEQLGRESRTQLVPPSDLDGLWRLEVEPLEISGVARLRSEGTLVTGTYRMDEGSQGSLTGTFADERLVLERIDFRRGFDATLQGRLDEASGLLTGSWTAVDVTGGAISGGTWTARRLSEEERRRFEEGESPP